MQRQVSELQRRIEGISTPTSDSEDSPTVTRAVARENAMVMLEQSNEGISATKGSRADGSGIVVTFAANPLVSKRILAKFYFSRSYPDPEGGWHGWHTVLRDVIQDPKFDLHIFDTCNEGQHFNFVISSRELQSYVKHKEVDSRDLYHFYFRVQENRATEYRDGTRDVTPYLERWRLASMEN